MMAILLDNSPLSAANWLDSVGRPSPAGPPTGGFYSVIGRRYRSSAASGSTRASTLTFRASAPTR